MSVYEPAEDTYLIYSVAKGILNKSEDVCEIGIGSGYVLFNLAEEFPQINFYGTDINEESVKEARNRQGNFSNIIEIKKGDLFSPLRKKKFDLVIFNPPYLPLERGETMQDLEDSAKALYGGKHGYEVALRFIYEVGEYLREEGKVLLILSSLSKPEIVEEELEKNLYNYRVEDFTNHFFERLYCYRINKSSLRRELEGKGFENIEFYSKGKHSLVLESTLDSREVIIKSGEEKYLSSEKFFMKKLKDKEFVPEIYDQGKGYICMEKVEGYGIKEFLQYADKESTYKVLEKVLRYCQILDKEGINKEEMTNPYKHIIIKDNLGVKFIDFERSSFRKSPQNTTQFLEFIRRTSPLLEEKGLSVAKNDLKSVSKEYKQGNVDVDVSKILIN